MCKKVLNCLVVLTVLFSYSYGQGAGENPADWLAISVGARPTAMGEAYAAVGNDASAIFWNPAGIVGSGKTEFMFQYGILPTGIGYHAVSLIMSMGGGEKEAVGLAPVSYSPYERYAPQYYTYPASEKTKKGLSGSAIGLGLSYLDSGPMDITEDESGSTGTFTVSYYCAMLSFSQAIGESIGIGITGKMINETIDVDSVSTIAADAGILFTAGGNLSIGVAIQNLGGTLYDIALPQNIKAGIGLSGGPFTICADVNTEGNTSVGGEMNLGGLALRAGLIMGMTEDDYGEAALIMPGMTVGFGIDTEALCLDLALVDYGALGDDVGPFDMPVRASLIFKF